MPRGRPRTASPVFVEDHTELDIANVAFPDDLAQTPVSVTVTTPRPGGKDIKQTIKLTRTVPFYGGRRYWFRCPDCETRCGKLYATQDGDQRAYSCRTCSGLVYRCQYRKDPYPELRRFLKWSATSQGSKRQWSRTIERGLEAGEMTWEEAWSRIDS